jgi:hypothetical protein
MQCIEAVLRGIGAKKGRVVYRRQVALSAHGVAGWVQREYIFGRRYCGAM